MGLSQRSRGKDRCQAKGDMISYSHRLVRTSYAQAGKDIIKRWVNERHDVVTAEDMKAALESHDGIKGCRTAVVEVDATKERNKDSRH